MANLNIPFLLLQEGSSIFNIDPQLSKIIIEPCQYELANKIKCCESDERKKMVILNNKQTDCLAICHFDSILHNKNNNNCKFIVSIQPKILCVPNIYPEDQIQSSLVDYCLVQSPASKILSTSKYMLVTLHRNIKSGQTETKSGRIRLWNVDDGRCIMISPIDILQNMTPQFITKINDQYNKGHVLCICEQKYIQIINVYSMTLVKQFEFQFSGVQQFKLIHNQQDIQLSLIDQLGNIFVWRNVNKQVKNQYKQTMNPQIKQFQQRSSLILNELQQPPFRTQLLEKQYDFQNYLHLKCSAFDPSLHRQKGRGQHRKTLLFLQLNNQQFIVIHQDKIELCELVNKQDQQIKLLLQIEKEIINQESQYNILSPRLRKKIQFQIQQVEEIEKWFIYANSCVVEEQKYLFCIDSEFNFLLYQVDSLIQKDDQEQNNQILLVNLFDDAHLFNLINNQTDQDSHLNLLQFPQSNLQGKLSQVKEEFKKQILASDADGSPHFNFFEDQNLLYAYYTQETLANKKHQTSMVSWSLQPIIASILTINEISLIKLSLIPLHINTLDIVSSIQSKESQKDPNSMININQFVTKHYFSRHQHSFFYTDELVTDQSFYVSQDYPSMILGTNYGRVFIVQLFQDIEGRAYPIIVIDCHHQQAITCLYVANSATKQPMPPKLKKTGMNQGQVDQNSNEKGSYLIACSMDGTISLTNLNSKEIMSSLANFSITRNDREKKRINQFMNDRERNHNQRRSHSITSHFSCQKYFNLVRVRPFQVFECCSFGSILRILEVQIIQQNQMDKQKYLQQSTAIKTQSSIASNPSEQVNLHTVDQDSGLTVSKQTINDQISNFIQGKENNSEQNNTLLTMKATQNLYLDHLQQIKDFTFGEQLASLQQAQLLTELIPFRASYACIDGQNNAVYVLQILNNSWDIIKIVGLDSQPIGVYEDAIKKIIHVITDKDLNVYTYCKSNKQLIRKSKCGFAQSILQINQTISTLVEKQQHFKQAMRLRKSRDQNLQNYDQYSFVQQFQAGGDISQKGGLNIPNQQSGHHKVLDYLSLSLSLPLFYHPHNLLSQKYTKSIKDMLPHRAKLTAALTPNATKDKDFKSIKESLRLIIYHDFVWNDRYKADFNQEIYQNQGAVTPLYTGINPDLRDSTSKNGRNKSFRQQLIIINTKEMIGIVKNRMRALNETVATSQMSDQRVGENPNSPLQEAVDFSSPKRLESDHASAEPTSNAFADHFQTCKWPTRLLALVHPFTLDENLDENLELFFGLSVPFVDFRLGVQGVDEAFSFIIARDESEKEGKFQSGQSSPSHCNKLFYESIKILRLSKQARDAISTNSDLQIIQDPKFQSQSLQINNIYFVNSEYWKQSPYMSTIISAYFLSTLVSIIEHAQPEITALMQDWLNLVQYITASSSNSSCHRQCSGESQGQKISELQFEQELEYNCIKPLSVTALSQLMLRQDHSISSCARDVIMKPLLSSGASVEQIKEEIDEWQDLVMDTYLQLKEDSCMRQAYEGAGNLKVSNHSNQKSLRDDLTGSKSRSRQVGSSSSVQNVSQDQQSFQIAQTERLARGSNVGGESFQSIQSDEHFQRAGNNTSSPLQDQSISQFFGELEVRALVNLSYYALYSQKGPEQFRVETDVQNRLCKCTVVLTREVMVKFTTNSKEHQNLLTILMQLLQTQMRAQVPTFKTKVIQEDVIKILLLIYDHYKKQLRDEKFLTRVVADNFHLIHPKNSELYLKLTAAKTLLEIGTYFTEDFLSLLHEQATTLKDGPQYQRNVLDVLRYFINGSREGLEPYLIQIVHTLLKCLDPNDEQLRKNSTQLISIILSTMVRTFPMIAFHHETQRLAVGTPPGPIAIYDVRTSAKWKVLEGHVKNVTCVEFDQKGNLLASYSAGDLTLRLWKVGNTGFFSTIMGGTGRSIKEIKLSQLKRNTEVQGSQRQPRSSLILKTSSQQASKLSMNIGKVNLDAQKQSDRGSSKSYKQGRGRDGIPQQKQYQSKIRFTNNEKSIELTREDGSIEEFKLIK